MPKKSLKQTNPYIKDKAMRSKIVEMVTVTSSGVEGVHAAAECAVKNLVLRESSSDSDNKV
jgi:hypothetical protein